MDIKRFCSFASPDLLRKLHALFCLWIYFDCSVMIIAINKCRFHYDIQLCDFKIPKNPIYEKISVFYGGFSLEECMMKVELKKWSYGFYCNESKLCGLGIDLQSEYERERESNEITPVIERCDLIVNIKNTNCEQILAALYDLKILRVNDYTCLGQGEQYCEREKLTNCEDVLGGFICRGCLKGAQPMEADNELKCEDINECDTMTDICGKGHGCDNKVFPYTCECQQGYEFSGVYGDTCKDVDECDASICGVDVLRCENIEGGYNCVCPYLFYFNSNVYGSGCADLQSENSWQNVFSLEAFSEVDIYRYFTEGDTSPAASTDVVNYNQIYRDIDMTTKLSTAKFIRFSLYDLDLIRVSYLIFKTLPEDNFETWFTWDRVYHSSMWDFNGRKTGNKGNKFFIRDPIDNVRLSNIRYFQIFNCYEGTVCVDFGWFVAINQSFDSTLKPYCPYELWWEGQYFLNGANVYKIQPPAFLYTDTAHSRNFNYHKLGGKITIDVIIAEDYFE